MSTTFKIGDRVRLTGERWRLEEMHGEIVEIVGIDRGDGDARFKYGGDTWWVYSRDEDFSATLIEPAPPPPDTRKRLREYTDLDNGDTVVIGGVALTMTGGYLTNEKGSQMSTGYAIIQDMLVDEVRRAPRMKKRRVYEEIEKAEAMIGDILITDGEIPYVYDGDENDLDGGGIFRFVEETEVPR